MGKKRVSDSGSQVISSSAVVGKAGASSVGVTKGKGGKDVGKPTTKKAKVEVHEIMDSDESEGETVVEEEKSLNPKAYSKLYAEASEEMGPPVVYKLDQIQTILRSFDNTAEYGPSLNLTRLQRWERAEKLGLKPPPKIKEILLTKEGKNDPDVREGIFRTVVA